MFKTIFISIISIFMFTGCISLTKELPSYSTYTLSLQEDKEKTSNYIDKSIYILEPKAIASINTKAINYSKESFKQEKYALSRWSDKPTKMLQEIIANYLVSSNSYKYITTSNIKTKSDFRLVTQLVDFKHTFSDNSSYADLSIRVFLINNKTDDVYFKNFSYTNKSVSSDAEGVVKAFNKITPLLLKDLNLFIRQVIRNK